MTEPRTLQYRPDIDGLRALAVLPVVLFHAALSCPGGFIGVDIFFVISGFLITNIIQKQLLNDTFSMLGFWEKRIRRIVPALALVVFCTIAAATFSFYPSEFKDFGKELASQSSMVANFYFWQQDGYFAAPSEFKALLHTWSLAVEEQFYFIFPFFLIWVHSRNRLNSRCTLNYVLIILVSSFLWSCYGAYKYPSASFYLLPSRAWELMIGAALAIYKPKQSWSKSVNEIISWLSLAAILACLCFYNASMTFPGLAALPPCLAAGMLIFCNRDTTSTAAKLLSAPPLVFIGKISYSFYLWHWPIIVFLNYTSVDPPSVYIRIAAVLASLILATLSCKFVEAPFRNNERVSSKRIFRCFYASTAIFILTGIVIYKGDGWKNRISPDVLKLANISDEQIKLKNGNALANKGLLPTIPTTNDTFPIRPILLWGDSHALYATPAINNLCTKYQCKIYVAWKSSTPPILGTTRTNKTKMEAYNESIIAFAKEHNIKDVILISRWCWYPLGDFQEQRRASLIDTENAALTPTETFAKRLPYTVKRLQDLGIRVWIVRQVPQQEVNPRRIFANALRYGRKTDHLGVPLSHHIDHQSFINKQIDACQIQGANVLDPLTILKPNEGRCLLSLKGKSLYRDRHHISNYCAELLTPLFEPVFHNHSKE